MIFKFSFNTFNCFQSILVDCALFLFNFNSKGTFITFRHQSHPFGIYTKGMTLMPESDEGAFTIEVEKEQGTIYQDTLETVESIEAELEDHSEVDIYIRSE